MFAHGAEAPTLRNTVFQQNRLKTIGEGKKKEKKEKKKNTREGLSFLERHTLSNAAVDQSVSPVGWEAYRDFHHLSTQHVLKAVQPQFIRQLARITTSPLSFLFFGNMYHGKKWLGATDGGAGSSMMMMMMNFEHSASASLFGYGANRTNPTPLLGALVQNAQGGDATRAGSKYEQRGRWNYVNLGTCWLTFFPCSRAPSGDGGWAPTSRLHVAGV